MYYKLSFLLLLLFSLVGSSGVVAQSPSPDSLTEGSFWKQQGIEEILPAWTEYGIDSTDGQFYAFMDREWHSYRSSEKYPGMMARHLFSFSTAYMMSGNKRFIDRADSLYRYLVDHGWDDKYGGWYYAIDREGQPSDPQKDLFMNIYAVAGLGAYYLVTHHREALSYIEKTRERLSRHAWDETYGGYYRRADRHWKVTDSTKVFTPQVAPVSGYLLYLYMATRNPDYLEEAQKLMKLSLDHLYDSETGLIREKFTRNWEKPLLDGNPEQVNIGHNLEVAWILLRLHAITGNESFKSRALALNRLLSNHAIVKSGAWIHKMNLGDFNRYPGTTPWWIQAYGNMTQLYVNRYTEDRNALDRFVSGARFWNSAFMDSVYGATVLSATLNGEIDRGQKAVRSKTSYHALEHALLNYLYLNLWVRENPVTLYFYFSSYSDSKPLCPLLLEILDPFYASVEVNGEKIQRVYAKEQCLAIPDGNDQSIKITVQPQ